MIEATQRQLYGQMICDKLTDKLLFDDNFPKNKENVLKITSVFNKFIDEKKLITENFNFSENTLESLKEIHELYQIKFCDDYGVSQEQHPAFCKLIDECISYRIEDFNKKNKKRSIDNLEDEISIQENKEKEIKKQKKFDIEEKLKIAENKRLNNLIPIQVCDENFALKVLEDCDHLVDDEEDRKREFCIGWMHAYFFSCQAEVKFVKDHWYDVCSITKFIGRLSFNDLLSLEHTDRKIFLRNTENLVLLFEEDKKINCAMMMDSPATTRNLIIRQAQSFMNFLDLKIPHNDEYYSLGLDDDQVYKENEEIVSFQLDEKENDHNYNNLIDLNIDEPKYLTVSDLLKYSYEELNLFLNYPIKLKILLNISEVSLDTLLKNDELQSLFQFPCTMDSLKFLSQFSGFYDAFCSDEKDFSKLTESQKQKFSSYWFEFHEILNLLDCTVNVLFEKLSIEDLNLMIENIDKIADLLQTKTMIKVEDLPKFLYGAVNLINVLNEEELNVFKDFSEENRYYLIENNATFATILTTDWKIQDFKEMSLEYLKEIVCL